MLVGITTDGEAANTGNEGGLWKLLQNHLQHKLLTVWCFCHRSDLAMESALATIPELKHWLTNTTAVASYFRTSPSKLKRMQQIFPDHHSFPRYFEVRFAEHVYNLISAILHNLPGCIEYWRELSNDSTNTPATSRTSIDKTTAKGMLKIWDIHNSLQLRLTCLMADIMLILQDLQKNLQKGHLILPDVITLKNNALRRLKLIQDGPYPGGKEEKLSSDTTNKEETNTDEENENLLGENSRNNSKNNERKRRKVVNSYVTTGTRDWSAIRNEIILSFINFLEERLNIEENGIIESFSSFLNSKNPKEMITNGHLLISTIFGEEKVADFAKDVCDC